MRQLIITFVTITAIVGHIMVRFIFADAFEISSVDEFSIFANSSASLEMDDAFLENVQPVSTDEDRKNLDGHPQKEWEDMLTMIDK